MKATKMDSRLPTPAEGSRHPFLRLAFISIGTAVATLLAIIAFAVLTGDYAAVSVRLPIETYHEALVAYQRDRERSREPVPNEIALTDLVRSGYLPPEVEDGFAPAKIFFVNDEKRLPQNILVRAVLPNGEQIWLLEDGSVQQLSADRIATLLRKPGIQ